jgi:hypothetical protein
MQSNAPTEPTDHPIATRTRVPPRTEGTGSETADADRTAIVTATRAP